MITKHLLNGGKSVQFDLLKFRLNQRIMFRF